MIDDNIISFIPLMCIIQFYNTLAQLQCKKIWSVSTRLSEHLIAMRHLNKLETESISIYKQN